MYISYSKNDFNETLKVSGIQRILQITLGRPKYTLFYFLYQF